MSLKPAVDFIARQGVENVKRITAVAVTNITYNMLGYESRVDVNTTAVAFNIYLPPVALMIGRLVFIRNGGANNLTVNPFKDSAGTNAADSVIKDGSTSETSQVLTNAGAFTLLMSTGTEWISLQFDLTLS